MQKSDIKHEQFSIPWLTWRVDGLCRGLACLEERVRAMGGTDLDFGSNEGRLKLLVDRLRVCEAQTAGIAPDKTLMQMLDMRLEQKVSEINDIYMQFHTQKVEKELEAHFDQNVSKLEQLCEQVRTRTLKETNWMRDNARLEFKLLSARLRNIMLDLDSAQLEADNSAMVENSGKEASVTPVSSHRAPPLQVERTPPEVAEVVLPLATPKPAPSAAPRFVTTTPVKSGTKTLDIINSIGTCGKPSSGTCGRPIVGYGSSRIASDSIAIREHGAHFDSLSATAPPGNRRHIRPDAGIAEQIKAHVASPWLAPRSMLWTKPVVKVSPQGISISCASLTSAHPDTKFLSARSEDR